MGDGILWRETSRGSKKPVIQASRGMAGMAAISRITSLILKVYGSKGKVLAQLPWLP